MPNEKPDNVHFVELAGTPFTKGTIYGETLRSQIREHADRFKRYIAHGTNQNPDRYLAAFLAATRFDRAVRRFTPDLWEEVKGIAAGAGVRFETIFALQLLDEEWWYRQEAGGAEQIIPDLCTAFGASRPAAAETFIAQTMDILGYNDGLQTLLKIRYPGSDLETLVLTSAGTIALNGLNSAPLALCVNTLIDLPHSGAGLPVAFIVRGILARESLEEAVSFLKRVPHASGQSYLLGGRDGITNYECSAETCVRVDHEELPHIFCHTNHPLAGHGTPVATTARENSKARIEVLYRQLGGADPPLLSRAARELMRSHQHPDHPICRHKKSDLELMTFAATVMSLGATPELQFSAGPPCRSEFISVGF